MTARVREVGRYVMGDDSGTRLEWVKALRWEHIWYVRRQVRRSVLLEQSERGRKWVVEEEAREVRGGCIPLGFMVSLRSLAFTLSEMGTTESTVASSGPQEGKGLRSWMPSSLPGGEASGHLPNQEPPHWFLQEQVQAFIPWSQWDFWGAYGS